MRTPRDNDRRLLRFAKELRESSTDAERKLWSLLRGRKLAGFKFRRQYPVGGYILDFYCIRANLALELDGGQHSQPDAVAYDLRRTQCLAELGVRVLRFWDHDVLKDPDAVTNTVFRVLSEVDNDV
ncbi:MAG: hypothetical protein JWP03_2591 [Phycisphaerales bacterium]|nr:hypothetical protein [Phycisphaerales bacterium]